MTLTIHYNSHLPKELIVERVRGQLVRKEVSKVALGFLPTEYTSDQNSQEALQKTEELLQEGYGIVVLYNHFSKSDHIRTLARLVLDVPTVSKRPILSPVGIHQHNWYLKLLGKGTNVKLMPIVTPNTRAEHPEKIPSIRPGAEMAREYLSKARQTLSAGGVLLLAPQAERKATLGKPLNGKPVKRILKNYANDMVAFLFAGLQIPGETDYSTASVRGLNRGREFLINLSGPLIKSMLLELSNYDLNQVDRVVFEHLRPLVSPAYLD